MGRRLGLSLLALGTGVALLVSAAFAGPHGDTRRGGTLRLMWGADPDSVDPALATGNIGSWTLLNATCAKLFNTLPDPATGRTGDAHRSRGRSGDPDRLQRRPDLHVRAEADVPLPQPHAGDRAELRRRVQPQRQTGAELPGETPGLAAGDRRSQRRHAGTCDDDLGRSGARPLPTARAPEAPCRRLHPPPVDAVLLPDLAGHAEQPRRDRTVRPDRGRTTSQTASRTGASSWNGIPTTGVAAPPTRTGLSGRSSPTLPSESGRPSATRTTSWGCSPSRTMSSATSKTGTA